MREVWLRPNRRALLWGLTAPLLLLAAGLTTILTAPAEGPWQLLRLAAWGLVGLAGLLVGVLAHFARTPRLAFDDGRVLVYLHTREPFAVPVEVVECFFLGQAPGFVGRRSSPARALVVRLAERARDWHSRDVKPALGQWIDGYITIRGTWCEPLDGAVVGQLNQRLAQIHRERRAQAEGKS
jgi:hypothetical protein